jgi:predicted amidophosphoribosyltransferase
MNVFSDFPLLSSFITLVAILLIFRTLRRMGGNSTRAQRECENCGASLPWNAGYCRRCGSKLKG